MLYPYVFRDRGVYIIGIFDSVVKSYSSSNRFLNKSLVCFSDSEEELEKGLKNEFIFDCIAQKNELLGDVRYLGVFNRGGGFCSWRVGFSVNGGVEFSGGFMTGERDSDHDLGGYQCS